MPRYHAPLPCPVTMRYSHDNNLINWTIITMWQPTMIYYKFDCLQCLSITAAVRQVKGEKCPHCDCKFTKRHLAEVHLKVTKKYQCDRCDKTFTRKENLWRHMNNIHYSREHFLEIGKKYYVG